MVRTAYSRELLRNSFDVKTNATHGEKATRRTEKTSRRCNESAVLLLYTLARS